MSDVCILITVYNGAPWIDVALDSAMGQVHISADVLVVDDGSTDGTADILSQWLTDHPDRLRVITIPQSGLSAARNIGFDSIEAEFTTCLDADDFMHRERVAIEVEALQRNPEAVISFSGRWNFNDGSTEGYYSFTADRFRPDSSGLFYPMNDPLSSMIEAGEYPGTDACTCRTEWARVSGRFNEDLKSFVDGERWIRCVYEEKAVYCAAPLYFRREHAKAMSAASPDATRNIFRALDEARCHWSDYSLRQQQALDDFENRAGTWIARRSGLAGHRRKGLLFLIENWPRLRSRQWLRTALFLLTPGIIHRSWRDLIRGDAVRGEPTIPLNEVTDSDPQVIWSSAPPSLR